MARVSLDATGWTTLPAFHEACRQAFGFPDFYGRNMDAWTDCMSGLRDGDGMTAFTLGPDEVLEIELRDSAGLRARGPAILEALQAGVEEVNARCAEHGEAPVLALILR